MTSLNYKVVRCPVLWTFTQGDRIGSHLTTPGRDEFTCHMSHVTNTYIDFEWDRLSCAAHETFTDSARAVGTRGTGMMEQRQVARQGVNRTPRKTPSSKYKDPRPWRAGGLPAELKV